jgi:(p)ppGpp synthase/HD superfamily hydrolase
MNNYNTLQTFTKALNFAAYKHRDQRRKNGDIPYINHPI